MGMKNVKCKMKKGSTVHDFARPFYTLHFTFFILLSAFTHPFHTSLTEVRYDQKARAFEVSIRLFTDDLEAALTRENGGKPVRFSEGKQDRLIEKYVRRQFIVADSQRKPKPIVYIGYEPEAEAQWVYLEIPNEQPDGFRDVVMKQAILMDVFDDQVNLVNLQSNQQKKTLVFRNNQSVQAVSL
jgi:hypothetical protein